MNSRTALKYTWDYNRDMNNAIDKVNFFWEQSIQRH